MQSSNISMYPLEEETQFTPMHRQTGSTVGGFEKDVDFVGPSREEEVETSMGSVGSRKSARSKKHETSIVADVVVAGGGKSAEKRARGRSGGLGFNNCPMTYGLGGYSWAAYSHDERLTPITLTVHRGEDIIQKILAFIQKGVEAIFILAASGPVFVVDLHPGHFGANFIRYEGYFELVSLGGFIFNEAGELRRDKLKLTANLAYPDGRVFGGAIGGSMIAAAPVQVVIGIIKQAAKKQNPRKRSNEPLIPTVVSENTNNIPFVRSTINCKVPDDQLMSQLLADDNTTAHQSDGQQHALEKSDDPQPTDHVAGGSLYHEEDGELSHLMEMGPILGDLRMEKAEPS